MRLVLDAFAMNLAELVRVAGEKLIRRAQQTGGMHKQTVAEADAAAVFVGQPHRVAVGLVAGGQIAIDTTRGRGTLFRLTFETVTPACEAKL